MPIVVPQILIAGTDWTTACRDVSYSCPTNAVGKCQFRLTDPAGVYIPDEDDTIAIYEGGVLKWSGQVAGRNGEFDGLNGLAVVIDGHDNNYLPQRTVVPSGSGVMSGTLKSILTALTTSPGIFWEVGITLDPAQATGATLVEFDATWWKGNALLNYLSEQTGWLWRIDESGVLSMWAVGTRASGVTVSLAQGNLVSATWEGQRYDYRNRQWVVYGPDGEYPVTDYWDGDGITRTFPLNYTANAILGRPIFVDGNPKPVGVYGVDVMEWTWDAATASFIQDASFPVLAVGQVLSFPFDTVGPNSYFAYDMPEILARGPWTRMERNTGITTYPEAVERGDALIRANLDKYQAASVVTSATGIAAGETLAVDVPEIGLDDTVFVASKDVQWEDVSDETGPYVKPYLTLKVLTGSERQDTPEELWTRIILGETASGSGGGSTGGGGGGSTGGGGHKDLGGSRNQGLVAAGSVTVQARLTAWTGAAWAAVGTGAAGSESDIDSVSAHSSFVATVTDGAQHRLEIKGDAGSWVPVPNWKPVILYSASYPSGTITVHVWTAIASGEIAGFGYAE